MDFKKLKIMQKDSVGQEVKIGDTIAYVIYNSMSLGQIRSFTKKGYPNVDLVHYSTGKVVGVQWIRGDYAKIFNQK